MNRTFSTFHTIRGYKNNGNWTSYVYMKRWRETNETINHYDRNLFFSKYY